MNRRSRCVRKKKKALSFILLPLEIGQDLLPVLDPSLADATYHQETCPTQPTQDSTKPD